MSESVDSIAPIVANERELGRDHDFLIVAIGASAGGIKAFRQFFEKVPADSGMSYVVILHLSPQYESKLAEVLQASTRIPVQQVRHSVRIEPDNVYVIPPNKSLSMMDGTLALSEINGQEERRAPVDFFFRTLAQEHGNRAVAVVLSGTGPNGSMGIKRVKEMGGIILAQDPLEAEYSDMPRNSIATGFVDYVLPVAEIPGKILGYKSNRTEARLPVEPIEQPETDESALRDILTHLRVRTNHDFSNYKRATIVRRIERRVNVHELAGLREYATYLQDHPEETKSLLKDLLISVTNFFRDPQTFATLEKDIVPRLFNGKTAADHLRIWIAGCATGEEAYSIGMMLLDYASSLIGAPRIQLFASDIDERSIAVAREGFYTEIDVADVQPERLRRYFVKEANGYRVRREMREVVLFAQQNLIKDPPFSHLDLVSCRNLLIYLNRAAQERVMRVLHFALNPGGFLFLGTSESIDGAGDLFLTMDKEAHLYQSRSVVPRLGLPVSDLPVGSLAPNRLHDIRARDEQSRTVRLEYSDLHHRLIEQYGPPSLVVNEEYEIMHLTDGAAQYLQFTGGEPSHNLLRTILPELRVEIRSALLQAAQNRTNVEARNVKVLVGSRHQTINLIVRPVLRDDDTARGYFLILFEESELDSIPSIPTEIAGPLEPAALHLEEELTRVKALLRANVEQHETQAEELKASNEELQAMNEELRSSTEELETSKEELQSVNEELTTVNQELKIKIEELNQSNNDFRNLMSSTDIGTIFLDRSLRIKLFTPRARDIFNLIPADTGRTLLDITSNLVHDGLIGEIEKVLEKLQAIEREVETRDGRTYLMRLVPYRTAEDRIEGVVLNYVEITERKRVQLDLRTSEERFRLLNASANEYAIFTLTPEGVIDSWNSGAERIFGYSEAEILGRSGSVLFTPEDRESLVPETEMRIATAMGQAADERWHVDKSGDRFYCSGVMTPLRYGSELHGFAKIARDLTRQREADDELQRAHDDLEDRVQERTTELVNVNSTLVSEVEVRAAAEERVRGLVRQLVTAQEDERSRIARDLHDHLGQQLTSLRLKLEVLADNCGDNKTLRELTAQAQSSVSQLDEDVDFLARELRPSTLDDLGLVAALTTYLQGWSSHFNIPADFHSMNLKNERFSQAIEINLYRIAQEGLNNISKHASATRVDVILERQGDSIVLIVEDNGEGFDADDIRGGSSEKKGLGLTGIHERMSQIGGTAEIQSSPSRGTTIFARVPVPQFRNTE